MTKKCVICQKEFESSYPKAKYCCFRCKQEGRRIISRRWMQAKKKEKAEKKLAEMSKGPVLKEKACLICGKKYLSNAHNRKYCDSCSKIAWKFNKIQHTFADTESQTTTKQPVGTVYCDESVMKKCKYSLTVGGRYICNYLEIKEHSRGCPPSACDKYEEQLVRASGAAKFIINNRTTQLRRKEDPSHHCII